MPLPQDAAAVAVALEARGTLAKRVTAGFPFFPFFAPASAAAPIAVTATASIAARALRLRIPSPFVASPISARASYTRRPAGLTRPACRANLGAGTEATMEGRPR